ncbi:MAG TPA: VCBS repeat-containing protein, partial [Polyangiaceae bacterium]|nr:VCBS repeat-containing protein [Polyangiaceae bacterium]
MTMWCRGSFFGFGVLAIAACSSEPEVKQPGGLVDMPGTGGSAGSSGGSGGSGGTGGQLGTGGTIGVGGASSAGSAGTMVTDPCAAKDCPDGQRCENQNGVAACVDRTCEELMCTATERCVSLDGGGHGCAPKCTSDAACDETAHCELTSGDCVPDDCTPDTRMCGADDSVRVCGSNGAPGEPIECGSAGYFASACTSDAGGSGACTCEDDWDCPPYMTCDAGICTGTGFAPTCTLPATPFKDVLPEVEFRWGEGTKHNYSDDTTDNAVDDAAGKAFSWSSQVVSPPLVINLDDDNGDGRADERDFPEIVFITHDTDNRESDGVVRAVHGGGPNKGKDFFALCGNPEKPAEPLPSYVDAVNGGGYWSEGADLVEDCGDVGDVKSGLARPSATPAAGDLDGDGFPEIVVPLETKGFQILSNRGEVLFQSPANVYEPMTGAAVAPAPALVNLDFEGMPEIVIGRRVIKLRLDAGNFAIDKIYEASSAAFGAQQTSGAGGGAGVYGPSVCVADLTGAPGMEIVAGPTAFKLPATTPGNCGDAAMPCPLDMVWDARSTIAPINDGLCAIADVLGACTSVDDCMAKPTGPGNPLDGKPEVVLIANGTLVILDGATGTLLYSEALGTDAGGAPNVDDFDGDGFPEIATALASDYEVFDLQPADATNCPAWPTALAATAVPPGTNPARNAGGACTSDADCTLSGTTCNEVSGQCVCLHNGWKRTTEDDSSRVTSSSVFDFNGDGAAEVAYGDECYFRVYDGSTGAVFLAFPSVSRTVLENPVVADVDNDGNAEIVFVSNNSFAQCDEGNAGTGMMNWHDATLNDWPTGTVAKDSLPAGITVLGDPTDSWVAARRIWNEHSYHVTNVLESGAI